MTIGSAQPVINLKELSKFGMIKPPKKEQEKIAGILIETDKKIEDFQNRKTKFECLKKGLMQKLLTGKIRVKI